MKTAVIDLETILNEDAAARCGYQSDDDFAPWPLHKIACASVLTVEREGWDGLNFSIRSFSIDAYAETAIIAGIEAAIGDAQEALSYNGRAFDVPVLLTRAAAADMPVPSIARMFSRSNAGYHADLSEMVTAFGIAPKPKLAEICAAFAIPCKMGANGQDVASLASCGDFERIRNYCETDVTATWLSAQMWQSSQQPLLGRDRWVQLADWIAASQPGLVHLLPYTRVPQVFDLIPPTVDIDNVEF